MREIGVVLPGEVAPRWVWTFSYQNSKLAGITDPAGRETTFTIDGFNNLVAVTKPDGTIRQYTYDQKHLLTHFTDESGAVTTYEYNDYGRITRIAEPLRTVYNVVTGQTEITQTVLYLTSSDTGYALLNGSPRGTPDDPAPPVITSGALVDRVDYGRGSQSGHTNKWGFWLDETDALGHTTYYTYDDYNNLTGVVFPDGDCAEFTYDEYAKMLSESWMEAEQCALESENRDPDQMVTWLYTYEMYVDQALGQHSLLTKITNPKGYTTTLVWDEDWILIEEMRGIPSYNLTQIIYPPITIDTGVLMTPTESYTYNEMHLLESITDIHGLLTKYIYSEGTIDEASDGLNPLFVSGVTPIPGLLTQVIEDYGDSTHQNLTTTYKDFNALGYPTTIIYPSGSVINYTYDDVGQITRVENDLGYVVLFEYDPSGNIIKRHEDYTPDGVSGRNRITSYTYDSQNQLLRMVTNVDDMLSEISLTYDANNKIRTMTDATGRVVSFEYNSANQLITYTNEAGEEISYSYTPRGRLAGVTYPDNGSLEMTSDVRGNLTSLNISGSPAHEFVYDYSDHVSAYLPPEVDPMSDATQFEYNALNLISKVTHPDGSETFYVYDEHLNPSTISLPRGQINYDYSPVTQQLTTITAPDNVVVNLEYDIDRVSKIIWSGIVNGNVSQQYDNYSRMISQSVNEEYLVTYQSQ